MKIPIHQVSLFMTNMCNMRCTYCWERNLKDKKEIVSNEIIKKTIDMIFETKKPDFNFFGGEPTLVLDKLKFALNYYLNTYYPKKLTVGINTNLYILTDEIIDFLKKLNKYTKLTVVVSLDGYEEIHNKNRIDYKKEGTYNNVVKNLKRIKKEIPDLKIERHSVLDNEAISNPEKILSSQLELSEYCDENVYSLTCVGPTSSINGDYTKESIEKFISFYFKKIKEITNEKEIKALNNIYSKWLFGKIVNEKNLNSCGAGYNSCFIKADGTILPCGKYAEEHSLKEQTNGINILHLKNNYLEINKNDYWYKYVIYNKKEKNNIIDFKSEYGYDCSKCPMVEICGYCIGMGEVNLGDENIRPKVICDRFINFGKSIAKYMFEKEKEKQESLIFEQTKMLYEIKNGLIHTSQVLINDNKLLIGDKND